MGLYNLYQTAKKKITDTVMPFEQKAVSGLGSLYQKAKGAVQNGENSVMNAVSSAPKNISTYFNTPVQQNSLWNKVDSGLNTFSQAAQNVPKFTFDDNTTWNNPIKKLGTTIAQPILNIPSRTISGAFGDYGVKPTVSNVIKRSANAANIGLDVGGLMSGGGAVKSLAVKGFNDVAKPTLKSLVINGAKTGAKQGLFYGTGAGAMQGLQQGDTVKEQLKNAGMGAVQGGAMGIVGGAVLGGATPVIGHGAGKVMNEAKLITKDAYNVANPYTKSIVPQMTQTPDGWVKAPKPANLVTREAVMGNRGKYNYKEPSFIDTVKTPFVPQSGTAKFIMSPKAGMGIEDVSLRPKSGTSTIIDQKNANAQAVVQKQLENQRVASPVAEKGFVSPQAVQAPQAVKPVMSKQSQLDNLNKYLGNAYKVYAGQSPEKIVAQLTEQVANHTGLPKDVVVKKAFFDKMSERHPEIDKQKLFSFVKTLNIPDSVYRLPIQEKLNFFRNVADNIVNVVGTHAKDDQQVVTSILTTSKNYPNNIKKTAEAVFEKPTGGALGSSSLMQSPPAGELPKGISGVSSLSTSNVAQNGQKVNGAMQSIEDFVQLPSEKQQALVSKKADVPFSGNPFDTGQSGQYNRWQKTAYDSKGRRMKSISEVMGIPREVVIAYGKKTAESMSVQDARDAASLLRLGYPTDVIDRLDPIKSGEIIAKNVKYRPPININAPEQQPNNKVRININGETEQQKVQSAIVNSERIKNEISIRGKDALLKGRALRPEDLALANKYEYGRSIDELSQEAKNPQAFKDFMHSLTDYYDFRLAADRTAGGQTPLRSNYLRHEWDLSKPEDLARFNEIANQRGVAPYNGFASQPRVFNTYGEGEALGFVRKNQNILGDLQNDFTGASTAISRQILKRGLNLAAPGKVSSTGLGKTEDGKSFINSNIPGLEGMSFHPSVNDQLNGFQPKTNKDVIKLVQEKGLVNGLKEGGILNTVGTLYDRVSGPMKHFLLNFSGFHSINVSANYSGASLFEANLKGTKGIAQSLPSFFSEDVTRGIENSFKQKLVPGRDYSVFDAGLRSGVNLDRGLPATGWSRLNPLDWQSRAIFDRELHTLKLNLVDQVFGNGKVDPESPKGIALGKEITMIMGEMNNATMNINPNTQKWLSRALLAPQFTESKYKIIGDALTHGGDTGGNLARKAVIGKTIVIGTLATLGTKLMTGQFPNLQQIILNYTVAPETQTKLTSPSGSKQAISWPKTFVSEPAGLITDPIHYGQARLAPALSDIISGVTNQDYYGNPIVDPNSKQPVAQQIGQNLVLGDLPIGAQNIVHYAQGKQTGMQTAINIGGLRVHTDPNDPTMIYFKNLDQARAGLINPNDVTAWDIIHPVNKTTGGEYIIHPTVWDSAEKSTTFLSHPNVLTAENTMNQSLAKQGQNVDPFFTTLTPDQQQTVLTYSTLAPQDPQKTNIEKNNPWMADFQNKRSDFFATLPPSNPDKPKSPIEYPQPTPAVEQLQNQYYQITDPQQRAIFMKDNPDLISQFAASEQYSRAIRAAKGLPQYDAYPEASPEIQKTLDTYNAMPKNDGPRGGNATRNNWIKNNQQAWDKATAYFAQTALYNLEKSAGQAGFQNSGFDQKGLKAINSLGNYDIATSVDANGNKIYSVAPGAGGFGFGSKASDPLNKEIALYDAKLTHAVRKGNLDEWKTLADQQYNSLSKIANDPNRTEAQRLQAENKMIALKNTGEKYITQGGFTAPKKPKYVRTADFTALDASLARLKAPSMVGGTAGIAKSIFGSMPRIAKAQRKGLRRVRLT